MSSQIPYVEILTPKVMVLGIGPFGRWLGLQGRALNNEISALIKEAQESSLTLSAMSCHSEKIAINEKAGCH